MRDAGHRSGRNASGARGHCHARRGWLTALLLAGLPQLAMGASPAIQIAVIVGPATRLQNISIADLLRVFSTEVVTADNGTRLIPINHPPRTADRVAFDRLVLGRDPEAVGRFWIDRRIRGGSGPPRTVDNVQALRRAVSGLPGAISYLRTSLVTRDVQVVRVNGKLPSDPGYPLEYQP